jgi:hypothetical protein
LRHDQCVNRSIFAFWKGAPISFTISCISRNSSRCGEVFRKERRVLRGSHWDRSVWEGITGRNCLRGPAGRSIRFELSGMKNKVAWIEVDHC